MTNTQKGPQRPGRVLIQMPDDLRAQIQREAFAAGRTLTAEINRRLRDSLAGPCARAGPLPSEATGQAGEDGGERLSEDEIALLRAYRDLPSAKQAALLTVLE